MDLVNKIKNSQVPIRKAKIVVLTSKNEYKSLFMLTTTRDGSIVIDPSAYIEFDNWRCCKYVIPKGPFKNINIGPTEENKLGNTGPKFTYHKSGIVTVGKTGKIPKNIRLEATELKRATGHIFTMKFCNINNFKTEDFSKNSYFYFTPVDHMNNIKVVGYFDSIENFVKFREHKVPESTNNFRLKIERDGVKHECTFFRIKLFDSSEKWLKLEFHKSNFVGNTGVNAILGWDIVRAEKNEEMEMLGIIGGADFKES